MKKAKILIAFALFFVLILSIFIFKPKTEAYSSKTIHPLLTQKIAELYNYVYEPDLTDNEIQSLMAGSTDEDTPPRWINHFYDPTTGLGWLGKRLGDISQTTVMTAAMLAFGKEPISAVNWAQNQELQNNQYSLYQGNRTFDSAVLYYLENKKQEAYYSLGYILHLIEDMTVPAHTRQDTHFDMGAAEIFEQILGVKLDKGEPYEKWTEEYGSIAPNLMDDLKKNYQPICSSLESCLIYLANYSNNNFFSEDSILDEEYKLPIASNYVYKDKYIYIYSKENILLSRAKIEDKTNILYDKTTNLSEIQQSYWDRLSPAAVLAGVEVVKYFHEQAEKAKNNEIIIERPAKISFWKKATTVSLWGEIARLWKLASFAAINPFSLWDDNSQQDDGQVENQSPNLLTDLGLTYEEAQERMDDLQELLDLLNNKEEGNNFAWPSFELPSLPPIEPSSLGLPTLELPPLELSPLLQPQPQDQTPAQLSSNPTGAPPPPIVTYCEKSAGSQPARNKIIINEVAWMGTIASADDEWIELKNTSSGQVNLDGWQLLDKEKQIKIILSGQIAAGGFLLLERTNNDSVPNINADFIYTGALNDTNEALYLFNGSCELQDEVLANPDWPAGDQSAKKTMERKNDLTWQTSVNSGGTPKAENSQSSLLPPPPPPPPATPTEILITEVQIEGENVYQDFIELYNPNNFDVFLKDYRLVKRAKTSAKDTSIKSWSKESETKILPKQYYLWASSTNENYPVLVGADAFTKQNIAADNGVAIRYGEENIGEIIDAVGWGDFNNILFENPAFPQSPAKNQSLARKITGNDYQDTDDNSADFEIQVPSPKTKNQQHEEPLPTDAMPPSAIIDLTASPGDNRGEIKLSWTAPSDDNGTVTEYQIKYSSQEINESNWASAADISLTIIPKEAGSQEEIIISGLTPGANYYFAIKSKDEAGNASLISNSPSTLANAITDHLVINEIQLGQREFIELYNPTVENINLNGYYFSYFSYNKECATNTEKCLDWNNPWRNQPFPVDATISAERFYLIGLNEFATSQGADWQPYTSQQLSGDAGAVVIFPFDPEEKLLPEEAKAGYIDAVAWGENLTGMLVKERETVYPVPDAEKSMERKTKGWDTDDNNSDFVILDTPTPKSSPPTVTIWDETNYQNCMNCYGTNSANYYNILIQWQSPAPDLDFYQVQYKLNDEGWQDWITQTTKTEETFQTAYSLFNDKAYKFRARAQDKEGNIGEWSEIEVDLSNPVVINEVASWGTNANQGDQWIELYNRSDRDVNLTGWKIKSGYGFNFELQGTIPAKGPDKGYFLLERNDNDTVSDISANQIFTGSFGNGNLYLENEKGRRMDEFLGGWSEDNFVKEDNYHSVERISPVSFGFDGRNWKINNGEIININVKDRGGNDIYGTPGQQNSNYLLYTTYYLDFVEDTVLKKEYSPYFIRGISTVFENTTLTIEPGVVMKFYGEYVNSAFGGLFIQGTLKAIGTADEPIVFTSYYDDGDGSDTNNDGNTTPPGPGYWLGLNFKESSRDSELKNVVVQYAGACYPGYPYGGCNLGAAGIRVEQTSISLKNSIIKQNRTHGVWLINSSSIIDSVQFIENQRTESSSSGGSGLSIDGGSPTIRNSHFENNWYALYLQDWYDENGTKFPAAPILENNDISPITNTVPIWPPLSP